MSTDPSGGDGDRTHYLLHAMQALYQLSYAPVGKPSYQPVGPRPTGSLGGDMADEAPPQRYTAALANEIEHKWQDRWDERARLLHAQPHRPAQRRPAAHRRSARPVRARHVPVPERRRAARRPSARLHRHRRVRPLPTDERVQRPARDGLRRVRSARRAVRGADGHASAGDHRREHRHDEAPAPRARARTRSAARPRYHRRRVLPLDAVDLPADLQLLVRRRGAARPTDRDPRAGAPRGPVPRRPTTSRSTISARSEQRALVDSYRLAYEAYAPVNWCPGLGTVLANEEVTGDGRSERGNFPVYRRPMKQWMLRITAYADRLLDDLDALDWTESIKLMQRNWIGRSTGASVLFPVESHEDISIEVFTTRPDTLFGATYMVLAPEHPLVDVITAEPVARRPAEQRLREQSARPVEGRVRRDRPAARRGQPLPRLRRGQDRSRTAGRDEGEDRASSPARSRSTRPTTSASRSSSPTTC